MKKTSWTSTNIKAFYRMEDRFKSIQTLYNAEERGEIPKANRITRGKIRVRHWSLDQLPAIGKKFGFLKPPPCQKIITKYIQKGGVLKSTSSFHEARTYALNGIKTLIIGQDCECSITDVVQPTETEELTRLGDAVKPLGLYHFLVEDAPLDSVIQKTSLPTLDIIPETHDLVVLDKWLSQQKRREYVYKDKLIPLLNEYEVILFDCNPGWSHLVENAIVCSDTLMFPLGCTLLAYRASQTNVTTIFEFQEVMNLKEQKLIMFSTLLERNSLSQQINAQYLSIFSDYIIPIPIRKTVKGEEGLACQQTIMEYIPKSPFACEYFQLINSIWNVITGEKSISEIQRQIAHEGE